MNYLMIKNIKKGSKNYKFYESFYLNKDLNSEFPIFLPKVLRVLLATLFAAFSKPLF